MDVEEVLLLVDERIIRLVLSEEGSRRIVKKKVRERVCVERSLVSLLV